MNSIRKNRKIKITGYLLAVIVLAVQDIPFALADSGPPIFAQPGSLPMVNADKNSIVIAEIDYNLVNPGQYTVYFGRNPVDVIFTANAPFVTFPSQTTIAVSGLDGVNPSCVVTGGGNELHCQLLPQGSGQGIAVTGNIQFKPLVQISSITPSAYVALGGSVLYYRTSAAITALTYSGAVNFAIKVN